MLLFIDSITAEVETVLAECPKYSAKLESWNIYSCRRSAFGASEFHPEFILQSAIDEIDEINEIDEIDEIVVLEGLDESYRFPHQNSVRSFVEV